MADGGETDALTARLVGAIADIPAIEWDTLANPSSGAFDPFVSHAFLSALENSGSVAPETGWTPRHLVLEKAGSLVGVAPLYEKAHSFGEYVFDHHWAEAFERAGGRYYPKLLAAIPFTPVPGRRLLAATPESRGALAAAIAEIADRSQASSAHVNFVAECDAGALEDRGFLRRLGVQYHWFNRGYETYDDFLTALSSRKRKALRRERAEAQQGINIRRLTGDEIDGRVWDAFWLFYQDTGGRKWGRPYLTRAFFDEISKTMADSIMMVVAESDGILIAGALNFIGGDALYGRYWGRIEDRPFLHFEICYHQAIEFAIERGLSRVEAGAQGEHKIARGYEPVPTLSCHWIADGGFRAAIARYLAEERPAIEAELSAISEITPYRKAEQNR